MTGIYYETQPTGQLRRELYAVVSAFWVEIKQKQAQHGGAAGLAVGDFDAAPSGPAA